MSPAASQVGVKSPQPWLVDRLGTKLLNNPLESQRPSSHSFFLFLVFSVFHDISNFDLNDSNNSLQIPKYYNLAVISCGIMLARMAEATPGQSNRHPAIRQGTWEVPGRLNQCQKDSNNNDKLEHVFVE